MVTPSNVLILDEPVNGLDPEGIRWVREFLRSLAQQGRTVLVEFTKGGGVMYCPHPREGKQKTAPARGFRLVPRTGLEPERAEPGRF